MNQGGKLAGGNPAKGRVDNDFYATHPDSIKALLSVEKIIYPALEPACGEGHISKFLVGGKVISRDLINRGYGDKFEDFLTSEHQNIDTVITNPPFNLFQEFVEKGLNVANKKVILFGKLQALEGSKRATFLQTTPLRTIYVFKKRQNPLWNGKDYSEVIGKKTSSTMAFAWFVWEKGYTGKPQIEWI
jgi:hypothetical protein